MSETFLTLYSTPLFFLLLLPSYILTFLPNFQIVTCSIKFRRVHIHEFSERTLATIGLYRKKAPYRECG